MSTNLSIKITALKESELEEADRIVRLAFGTFVGVPDPLQFMDDRSFVTPRWHAANTKFLAARDKDRLIGLNVLTRWGSFAFFGPLAVLPDYWNHGVAQRLLASTMTALDRWGVRRSGLFTFAESPKHVALYQKFGYWPGDLFALLTREPQAASANQAPTLLSGLTRAERERAIEACAKLTNRTDKGLDLSDEIRSVLKQRLGDVVLISTRHALDGFAICLTGPGSEGGEKLCYIKFAAARSGAGADKRFDQLLDACDAFAMSRGVAIEAGVNFARAGAFQRMKARGYRVTRQGVSMQRPHEDGFNRADAWVIDDWR